MTAPIAEVAGPACDVCGQEPAIASLMFLMDYSQVKFGIECAAAFLAQQLAAIEPGIAIELVTDAVAAVRAEIAAARQLAEAEPEYPDVAPGPTETVDAVLAPGQLDVVTPASQPPAGSQPQPDLTDGPDGDGITADDTGRPAHWAGTKQVVRSTHGHRRGRQPADGETE